MCVCVGGGGRVGRGYSLLYNNQINVHVLIGQSAMVYYASKPREKLCVLRISIQKQ